MNFTEIVRSNTKAILKSMYNKNHPWLTYKSNLFIPLNEIITLFPTDFDKTKIVNYFKKETTKGLDSASLLKLVYRYYHPQEIKEQFYNIVREEITKVLCDFTCGYDGDEKYKLFGFDVEINDCSIAGDKDVLENGFLCAVKINYYIYLDVDRAIYPSDDEDNSFKKDNKNNEENSSENLTSSSMSDKIDNILNPNIQGNLNTLSGLTSLFSSAIGGMSGMNTVNINKETEITEESKTVKDNIIDIVNKIKDKKDKKGE